MTLDGPFLVDDLNTGVTITDALGNSVTTYTPASGVHYKTDTVTLKAHPEFGPYVVTPSHPLQSVWAGDSPQDPQWTVSLRFPDQVTADGLIKPLMPSVGSSR